MRVMVFVKGDAPADVVPTEAMMMAMNAYNKELAKAGIMLTGDGLRPSAFGKRVQLSGGKASVTDGPFAEAKEIVGGYWIWRVNSMDEAVQWLKKAPFPPNFSVDLEIRPISEEADFGKEFTPALREQTEQLKQLLVKNQ